MKSFKEIVQYIISHGRKSFSFIENVSTDINWDFKDNGYSIRVAVSYYPNCDEVKYHLCLFNDTELMNMVSFSDEDKSDIVNSINYLELIP